jgi:hypothetical protein
MGRKTRKMAKMYFLRFVTANGKKAVAVQMTQLQFEELLDEVEMLNNLAHSDGDDIGISEITVDDAFENVIV